MSDEGEETDETRLVRREAPDEATRVVRRGTAEDDTRLVRREAPDEATRVVRRTPPDDATRVSDRRQGDHTVVSGPREREAPAAPLIPTAREAIVPGAEPEVYTARDASGELASVERQSIAPPPDRHAGSRASTTVVAPPRHGSRVVLLAVAVTAVVAAVVAVIAVLILR